MQRPAAPLHRRLAALLACVLWMMTPHRAGALDGAPSGSPGTTTGRDDADGAVEVLLLAPIWSGDVPATHRETIADRFAQGFEDAGAPLVRDAGAPPCATPVCRAEQTRARGAAFAVGLEVRVIDRDYRLRALLVDGEDGRVIGEVEETCRICGMEEVAVLAGDQAVALQDKLAIVLSEARLTISSTPPSADVTLDGTSLGKTPLSLRVAPGDHRITVSMAGHSRVVRHVELVARVHERVDLVLSPLPTVLTVDRDETRENARERRRRRALVGSGGALLVLGSAAIAGGVPLLLRHGDPVTSRCDGIDRDYLGQCRYVHDTRGGALAMMIVGGAVIATGIALLGLATAGRRGGRSRR